MSVKNILLERRHMILAARLAQIKLNHLAIKGGRPYINAQLWRAPNEPDISWEGTSIAEPNVPGLKGRKDRACIVNDAGRVAGKINQYLFKESVLRDGIDVSFAANVDGQRSSIGAFFERVSDEITATGWCWVQVDRAAAKVDAETGQTRNRTLLEKLLDSDFIRWKLWPAESVVDWSVDEGGNVVWLLTESFLHINADPFIAETNKKLRTLWRNNGGVVSFAQYVEIKGEQAEYKAETVLVGMQRIPFMLLGSPSSDPWWFDDVETIQAQCMNLDSLNIENHVKTTYPQLVIPADCLENLGAQLTERVGRSSGVATIELVREFVRGLAAPIVESSEEKGITRYIEPNADASKILPDEINRKRGLLFDMVGLSLFNKETKAIQTAESKQFDQLDTESTLKHRALFMQESEEKLVELSKEIDPEFSEYDPIWPDSFDVVDLASDSQTVTLLGNLPDNTPSMRKLVMLAVLRLLEAAGGKDEELLKAAREEIKEMEFDTLAIGDNVF